MKPWLILALLACARLTCAQTTISGGTVSGGTVSFNALPVPGPPSYAKARIDRNLTTALMPPNYPCPPALGTATCNSAVNGQGLINTGWLLGTNTVVTDPNYNNVQMMRLVDYSDTQAPYNCVGPEVGPGGSAEENVWDEDDTHLIIQCAGSGRSMMKTFNPTTLQTSGYVSGWTGTPSTYYMPGGGEFDYGTPNTVYLLVSFVMQKWTVSGAAVTGGPTTVASFSYGIPCWQESCPDWTTGTFAPGTNLMPLTGNPNNHVFQLINSTSCTNSGSYPTFNTTEMTIVVDGACNLRDIGPINVFTHSYLGTVSHNSQWVVGLANFQGDGGNGSVFVVYYDPNAGTAGIYYSLNTSTGNTYTFTCGSPGVGPTCSGGSFTKAYTGNIIPYGTQDLFNIHNVKVSKGGTYVTIGPQKCADAFPSTPCPINGGGGILFWNVAAATQFWPGSIHPGFDGGHHASGYGILSSLIGYNSTYPSTYSYGTGMAAGAVSQYWKMNVGLACSPNACPSYVPFDYHSSWVADNSGDTYPACASALSNSYGNWPYQYPYQGEVFCFATDGTNTVWREGFTYNTFSNPVFNSFANVGSESSDGKFWADTTDWWCTLGSTSNTASNLCGFNWQALTTYNLNDLIAPGTNNDPVQGSSVYEATSCSGACTTGATHPTWPASGTVVDGNVTWTNCNGITCNGIVNGKNNAMTTVVVYKLQ